MPRCPQCHGTYPAGQFCPKDGTRLVPDDGRSDATPPPDPLIGQVVADRFRVVSQLGVGGMGTVYEAEHCFIKKRVALKLLRPEITSSPDALTRFQREALAASTIGHENIVTIDDFGRLADGQVYLTMEYLDGFPLNQVIRADVMPVEQILEVMLQTCHGLAAAHAKGIIHRDMKPENIFLVDQGRKVKILDFGIAKVTRGDANDTNLTKTGAIFGTPNYMAPEQALGKKVDHRADVYAMGIILYELLAGVVPFRSDSFLAILTQHVTKPPRPPSELANGRNVPRELEQIALKAISKEPDARYQDMGQIVGALLEARATLLGDAPLDSQLRLSRIRPPASQAPTALDMQVASVNPTATAGELVAPTRPPRRTGLIIGMMSVAILAGAGGVVAYVRLRDPAPPVPPPLVAHTAASQPTSAAPKPPAREEKPAPVAEKVKVLLTSVPDRASIMREGKVIGRTPESLYVEPGKAVSYVLRRPGYRDQEVTISAEPGQQKVVKKVFLVSLRPRRVHRPRRDRTGKKGKQHVRPTSDHGDHGSDNTTGGGHESSHVDGH